MSQIQGHGVNARIRLTENPITSSEIEPKTFQLAI
jgi:hypothetical protein